MLAFFIGTILGIFYFGGLYLTVQKIYEVKYPSLLMTLSLMFRMGGLVVAFFYISKNGHKNILLALIGVILIRIIMIIIAKNRKIKFYKKR